MMKYLCSLLTFLIIGWNVQSQDLSKTTVYFASAKYDLTSPSISSLDKFIEELSHLQDYFIEIVAHTDNRGTQEYNKTLANQRALSVQSYLKTHNLTIKKTTINSFGEQNPSFSNDTEAGRRQNRRVDIIARSFEFEHIDEVFSMINKEKRQHFHISINRREVIRGEDGTILIIPPNSFEYADGSNTPIENVTIHLEEAYTFGDLMRMKLTTTSDDKLLETGGSLRITATSNGKELKIKENKSISLKMPTLQADKDMKVFTGNQPNNGEFINWQTTSQKFSVEHLHTKTSEIEHPNRPKILPVVLNANGEIEESITKDLYTSGVNLEINEDYVPFYLQEKRSDPIFQGYIPQSLANEWNELHATYPDHQLKKPHFSQTAPKKPKRENIKYNPSKMTKLKLGKKGVAAKREAIYQKKLNSYEKKLAKYQTNKANFEKRLAAYQDDLAQFENGELKEWEEKKQALQAKIDGVVIQDKRVKEHEMWMKNKEDRISDIEAKIENGEELEDFEVTYYASELTTLGYINCDKFRIPGRERLPVIVKKTLNGAIIYVLVKRFKTMIGAMPHGAAYKTQKLPKNLPATVIGFSTVNGQVLLAKQNIRTGSDIPIELNYQPVSLEELKEELAKY